MKIVHDAKPGSGIILRGDNRVFLSAKEHEVILCGPSDTGKTFASCVKAHLICLRYPGAQGVIARKTAASLSGSVLRTFIRTIAGHGVRQLGGETPTKFIYPNGSTVWTCGLDNADRVLSSERDFIYVNQAEELALSDWETLATRCSGRASIIKNPQLMGDCNPAGIKHWIKERAAQGKLRLLNATHRDNPTIYDAAGNLTEQGKMRLAVLLNLSGVRRKRLFEGIWATAEGAVFEMFDQETHVKSRSVSQFKEWNLALDEGYVNPAVVLLIGEDSDGRWHVHREFHKSGVLPAVQVGVALGWAREFRISTVAVDSAAASLIAELNNAGLPAVGGKGRVLDGIQRIQDRLAVQGDGMPRLTIDPSCKETINEFESYRWKNGKDVPEKEFDHSVDSIRYLADVKGESTGAWTAAAVAAVAARLPVQDEDSEPDLTDVEIDL